MDKLLRCGTLLVGLSFVTPAFAQMYDELAAPVSSTNCRAVVAHAEIDGTMQQIVGRACLQSDGIWQMVQCTDGSVLWYPVATYPYPYSYSYSTPWWWGPRIFVGAGVRFLFVDRFHHFHHFNHFHQMDHGHFGGPIGAGFHRSQFAGGGGMGGFGGMRRH
jgi:surface antigen